MKNVLSTFFFIKKPKVQSVKKNKKFQENYISFFFFFWKDGNLKRTIEITTFGFYILEIQK